MRGKLTIQTILLFLIIAALASMFQISFAIPFALVLGLIPLIYRNKIDKKQILKLNVMSSIISLILILLLYFLGLALLLTNLASLIQTQPIDGLSPIQSIFNLSYQFPINSAIYLVLFNIPFLVYFIANKKKNI